MSRKKNEKIKKLKTNPLKENDLNEFVFTPQIMLGVAVATITLFITLIYIAYCLFFSKPLSTWQLFMNLLGTSSLVYAPVSLGAIFIESWRELLNPSFVYGSTAIVFLVSGLRAFGVPFDFDVFKKQERLKSEEAETSA